MAAKPVAFYQVKHSFITTIRGAELEYHQGEVVDDSDLAFRRDPSNFEPLVVRQSKRSAPVVEQATAAPGESRAAPEPEAPEAPPVGKALTTDNLKGRGT
jgi:hypothetical protein